MKPLNASIDMQPYNEETIRTNHANLKRRSIADLEAIIDSNHASLTTKGLAFLLLQKRKPAEKRKLPPKQFVCV